jgi:AraC-like DNA-binding protein
VQLPQTDISNWTKNDHSVQKSSAIERPVRGCGLLDAAQAGRVQGGLSLTIRTLRKSASAKRQVESDARALALLKKSRELLGLSPVAAGEHADEALAIAVRRGDNALIGEAALLAAQAQVQCGHFKRADEFLTQSVAALEASRLRRLLGTAYMLHSKVFLAQDRISDASAAASRGLEHTGLSAKERARLYATVAVCFLHRADLPSGRRVMQEHALPAAERSGDPSTFVVLHSQGVGLMQVYALWSLGIAHNNTVGLERPPLERPQVYIDTAKRYASACEPFLPRCIPAERAFAMSQRALITSLSEGWHVARARFEEALSMAADFPRSRSAVLIDSGIAARVAGEWDEARARLEEARDHSATQSAYYQRVIGFELAQVYEGLSQPHRALQALNTFTQLQTRKGKLATGWLANRGATRTIRGPVEVGSPQDPSTRSVHPAVLKRAVAFIEQNLARRIALAEVARNVGISTRTLQNLHKAHHGVSAGEFIRERRMQKAKQMLVQGQAPISQIADLVGYSSPANFSRDFRKRFGHAPSTVRGTHD